MLQLWLSHFLEIKIINTCWRFQRGEYESIHVKSMEKDGTSLQNKAAFWFPREQFVQFRWGERFYAETHFAVQQCLKGKPNNSLMWLMTMTESQRQIDLTSPKSSHFEPRCHDGPSCKLVSSSDINLHLGWDSLRGPYIPQPLLICYNWMATDRNWLVLRSWVCVRVCV